MSDHTSESLMRRYFQEMADGGDFGRHLTEDVTWTNAESGDRVQGRAAVARYIVDLHARMADVHTRTFAVAETTALVEGDCVPAGVGSGEGSQERLPYAVVYDIAADQIAAMRLYMAVSRLGATIGSVP